MYVVSEALRLKLLNHVRQKVCLPNVFVRSLQMFPFVLFGFVLRNCCLLELVLFYLEFACRICSHHLNALKDASEIKEDAIPAEAVPEVHVVPLRVESLQRLAATLRGRAVQLTNTTASRTRGPPTQWDWSWICSELPAVSL